MSLKDQISDAFGGNTDEEKLEAFEQSTIAMVCRQLGAKPGWVKHTQRDLGPEFGSDWFNELNAIDPAVYTTRVLRFNFEQLYTKPTKHPITEAYKEVEDSDPFYLCFKVYGLGRMIATALDVGNRTHLCIRAGATSFNVTPFAGYFSDVYGERLGDYT